MTVDHEPMTADELLRLPRGRARHELVRGVLRTMPLATWEEGCLASTIGSLLGAQVEQKLGAVVAATGFQLAWTPDTVRAPAVGFVRRDRCPVGEAAEGYSQGAPDLAVEVISPNDLYTEVDEKVGEWLEHGTRMVLVVNRCRRTVAVHRPGRDVGSVSGLDEQHRPERSTDHEPRRKGRDGLQA